MGTVSIWIKDDLEKCLSEVAESENISVGQYIKEIIEKRFIVKSAKMDQYSKIVNDLYNWHYYYADSTGREIIYIKRILLEENSNAIIDVLSQYDSLRVIARTLGCLMTAVALNEKRGDINPAQFFFIKQIKYDIIQNFHYLIDFPPVVNKAKILWMRTIEKIRDLSFSGKDNWEKYAFTAGIHAITKTSDISEVAVFTNFGFSDYEEEWSKLILEMKEITTRYKDAISIYRCSNCLRESSTEKKCPNCGNTKLFTDFKKLEPII